MKYKPLTCSLLLFLIATLISSCSQKAPKTTDESSHLTEIKTKFNAGKNIVVLFLTPAESTEMAEDGENELYADWEYYLNSFAAEQNDDTVFIQAYDDTAKNFFKNYSIPSSSLSLLFMKKGKTSLYYEQPIIEPFVYNYVSAYFNNKEHDLKYHEIIGLEPGEIIEPPSEDIHKELGFSHLEINFN